MMMTSAEDDDLLRQLLEATEALHNNKDSARTQRQHEKTEAV